MSEIKELMSEVTNKVTEETMETMEALTKKWIKLFGHTICKDNLNKFLDHVKQFYGDLMQETSERQTMMEEKIEHLEMEAARLTRLLNVDNSPSINHDVPLFTACNMLDDQLLELRERLKMHKDEIIELLIQQDALCEELGESPRELLDDPLPTIQHLEEFRQHLNVLRAIKVERFDTISSYRRDIKQMCTELELKLTVPSEVALVYDRHIQIRARDVNMIRDLHSSLKDQCEQMRDSIDTMRNKLTNLWDCLEVDSAVIQKFEKYQDYNQTTHDKLTIELNRCEEQKRQNIKRFVDKIRAEIAIWWKKTLKSDLEQGRFSNYKSDCYTEDLLTLHELELEDLKSFYAVNEKLFSLYGERQTLWERLRMLESKENDPGRYNNRGGQLLKEEKERKLISTKVPKIEDQIKALAVAFEEEHNHPFWVNGRDIKEVIDQDYENRQLQREQHMSARKAQNNLTVTPSSRIASSKTPMSARSAQVSRLRITPSVTNLSSVPNMKRKMKEAPEAQLTAKRSLFNKVNSPSTTTLGVSRKNACAGRTPFKSPARKIIATLSQPNRRSGRLSGSSKRRSRSQPLIKPKIQLTKPEKPADSSYELFEEHIQSPYRSSIMHTSSLEDLPRRDRRVATPKATLASLRLKSPLSVSKLSGSRLISSPGACSTRKLTTKNLPIAF